jgi:hypothetical protein
MTEQLQILGRALPQIMDVVAVLDDLLPRQAALKELFLQLHFLLFKYLNSVKDNEVNVGKLISKTSKAHDKFMRWNDKILNKGADVRLIIPKEIRYLKRVVRELEKI